MPLRSASEMTYIVLGGASDSLKTYGAIEMCFDWLID